MTARTLAGLSPQVAQPTDVSAFIRAARADLAGTDYPGALALADTLASALRRRGALVREVRLFAARFIIALEDDGDVTEDAIFQIEQTLAELDFKNI